MIDQYELYEGLQDSINKRINKYASEKGLHSAPGWVTNPEKRRKITKDVLTHAAHNPRQAAKFAAGELIAKIRPQSQPKPQPKPSLKKPRTLITRRPNRRLTRYQKDQLERQRRKGTSIDRSTNPYYVPGTNR